MVGTVTWLFWPIEDVLPGETLQYVEQTPDSDRYPFLAERIRYWPEKKASAIHE